MLSVENSFQSYADCRRCRTRSARARRGADAVFPSRKPRTTRTAAATSERASARGAICNFCADVTRSIHCPLSGERGCLPRWLGWDYKSAAMIRDKRSLGDGHRLTAVVLVHLTNKPSLPCKAPFRLRGCKISPLPPRKTRKSPPLSGNFLPPAPMGEPFQRRVQNLKSLSPSSANCTQRGRRSPLSSEQPLAHAPSFLPSFLSLPTPPMGRARSASQLVRSIVPGGGGGAKARRDLIEIHLSQPPPPPPPGAIAAAADSANKKKARVGSPSSSSSSHSSPHLSSSPPRLSCPKRGREAEQRLTHSLAARTRPTQTFG